MKISCPDVAAKGKNCIRIAESVLEKGARAREGNQGQCSRQKLCNRVSMVLGCGQKFSGEEVSISLHLHSRTTDRPDKWGTTYGTHFDFLLRRDKNSGELFFSC